MTPTVKSRIDGIKALSMSQNNDITDKVAVPRPLDKLDSLSKSIRNEKEADIFRNEYKIALKLSKK